MCVCKCVCHHAGAPLATVTYSAPSLPPVHGVSMYACVCSREKEKEHIRDCADNVNILTESNLNRYFSHVIHDAALTSGSVETIMGMTKDEVCRQLVLSCPSYCVCVRVLHR